MSLLISSCPHVLISSSPHLLISSYPHLLISSSPHLLICPAGHQGGDESRARRIAAQSQERSLQHPALLHRLLRSTLLRRAVRSSRCASLGKRPKLRRPSSSLPRRLHLAVLGWCGGLCSGGPCVVSFASDLLHPRRGFTWHLALVSMRPLSVLLSGLRLV